MAVVAQQQSSMPPKLHRVALAGRHDEYSVSGMLCGHSSPFSEVSQRLRDSVAGSTQQLVPAGIGLMFVPPDPNAPDAWNVVHSGGDLMWNQLIELLRVPSRTRGLLPQGYRFAARMRHFPDDLVVLGKINWQNAQGAHFLGCKPADKGIYPGTWFFVRE